MCNNYKRINIIKETIVNNKEFSVLSIHLPQFPIPNTNYNIFSNHPQMLPLSTIRATLHNNPGKRKMMLPYSSEERTRPARYPFPFSDRVTFSSDKFFGHFVTKAPRQGCSVRKKTVIAREHVGQPHMRAVSYPNADGASVTKCRPASVTCPVLLDVRTRTYVHIQPSGCTRGGRTRVMAKEGRITLEMSWLD